MFHPAPAASAYLSSRTAQPQRPLAVLKDYIYTERHESATIIGCGGGLWPPDFKCKDRRPEAAATESERRRLMASRIVTLREVAPPSRRNAPGASELSDDADNILWQQPAKPVLSTRRDAGATNSL